MTNNDGFDSTLCDSNDENANNNHLVFGAGLIGGFLGGALHKAGLKPVLIGRGKALGRLQLPLTVSCIDGDSITINNTLAYEASQFEKVLQKHVKFNFIWLTTKAVGIIDTLAELKPFVGESTVIICCQNGLGSTEIIKENFPNNPIVKAVVVYNVAEVSDNHLHRGTEGEILIETHPAIPPNFASSLNTSLSPIKTHPNIEGVIWAKLQINLVNALNAVSNLPVKAMIRDRRYRHIYANILSELPAVAKAKGIKLEKIFKIPSWVIPTLLRLPDFLYRLIENSAVKMDETTRASMWWDIKEGRKTEIDFIQGALLREAKQLNIECPFNQSVFDALRALEEGSISWEEAGKALLSQP